MKRKLLFSLCLAVTLTACSSAPTHLIVAPELPIAASNLYADKSAQLQVTDMRTSNHIVQILKSGEAATILSSSERLETIVKNTLQQSWKKQGLTISELANNHIDISIEKAIISVEQATMSYTTQSEIILQVRINNGSQTLTNTFKSRANSEGALKADIAVLERDFNQNLTTLLLQVLQSKDIKAFL